MFIILCDSVSSDLLSRHSDERQCEMTQNLLQSQYHNVCYVQSLQCAKIDRCKMCCIELRLFNSASSY